MKFLSGVFGTRNLFDTKCEYTSKCTAYREDSYTCTEALDKSYCGIYKLFCNNPEILYTESP